MLFKTSNELKDFIPLNANFAFNRISPFIKTVERDFLAKDSCLGQAQYDDLNSAYTTGSPSDNQKKLLAYAQEVVACFAFVKWIDTGQLNISDIGIRIDESDTSKTAYQYQTKNLKSDWIENGYSAQEALLGFLQSNSGSYPIWTASSAYAIYKEFLFTGAQDFQTFLNINCSRRTYAVLAPTMRMVESLYIVPTISSDYLTELKTKVFASTLNNDDKNIISDLKRSIANLAVFHATKTLPVVVSGDGIVINSFMAMRENSEQQQQASMDYLTRLQREMEDIGKTMLEKVREMLNDSASETVYPTYFESGLFDDPDEDVGSTFWENGNDNGQVVL